jgi:HD superfamily phosphohydrolase
MEQPTDRPPYGSRPFGSPVARRRAAPRAHKSIFDPVHGPISLDELALRLIAAPAFQRLWTIRQTGFAHLVFPGANHTRLEHSLGTFWVAREMARRFGLPEPSAARVECAALLHDLGHAPLSHTLDGPMREVLGVDHERLSRALIEGRPVGPVPAAPDLPAILERGGLASSDVADLIDPTRGRAPRLLGSILHSAIDADRIDYLQRDAHYTGVAHGAIDAVRLLDTLRGDGRRPFFAEKGRSAVEGFLVGRALMYASVYYHKTVRAAEMMAQAAVERLAGYPDSARGLFHVSDGELLVRLRDAGGRSAKLVEALFERRLYKRVVALRSVPAGRQRAFRRLLDEPEARRQAEDELAGRVGAPPATVLIDVAGVDARGRPADDWAAVGVAEAGRVGYPFRRPGPWRALAVRPPSEWAVSVYVAPAWRARAERRITEGTVERIAG